MSYEQIKNKIRKINNLVISSEEDVANLELTQVAEDNKLDISELLTIKHVINLTSEFQSVIPVPAPEGYEGAGGYYSYTLTLLKCPLYIIPYIKIATIGDNTTGFSNSSYIRIHDIEDTEEIVNSEGGIDNAEKTVEIFCGALTGSDSGIKIKFLITIINPREFR